MEDDDDSGQSPYAIDSVDNALQVLLILRERQFVRVVDVSLELGIARSTAHRLLATLAHRRFVIRDPMTRTYRGGPELYGADGPAARLPDVRQAALPHLEALSQRLHETVNLMVLEGARCRFIDGVNGDRPLRTSVRTGASLPAHATSGGKALLSELPIAHVRRLYSGGLQRMTEGTIGDLAQLEEELQLVRKTGYGINVQESEFGLSAIGVVLRRRGRAVAAIAISMPSLRMEHERVPELVKALRRTSLDVEQDLDTPSPAVEGGDATG